LWWRRERRDFTDAHAGWCTPEVLRRSRTTFADLARPYRPDREVGTGPPAVATRGRSHDGPDPWLYLALDDASGYATAADRGRVALAMTGLEIDWTPMVPGAGWGLGFAPPRLLDPFAPPDGPAHRVGGAVPGAGPVVVVHLVPEYLPLVRQRCPDAFIVGHTAWETDRIPGHWVPCLDAADLVVVPSRFAADAVGASAVSSPVVVVPHVVAPLVTFPVAPGRSAAMWSDLPSDQVVFYTIAEWNERKAVAKTVEAYLRAFTSGDPVTMVVKTSFRDFGQPAPSGRRPVEPGTTAWALARLLARHRDPPAVHLVTRELAEGEIQALHRRADCFVSLCRGEGWGLGAFDAAAWGNPVVTTAFGGHLDFLADSPLLVDFELVAVDHPAGIPSYAPDQRWADPNVDHAAVLLRDVAAHLEAARAEAAARAPGIRWTYRPDAVGRTFRSAVDAHRGARSGVRPGRR
jgi:glycosyltransferase involved in cell wall biosynthesis